MTNQIRAVGYIRCSTEMQEDSPEQQRIEIERFAARSGYIVEAWYIDFGKSGTTFDQRPEFQRLWNDVEKGCAFKAVICYDESRWGRAIDAEENTFWRVHFRKQGVDVVLVKTSIDPKHEYAPMLKAFESVQASQYSKKLSELTLRGAMNNGKFSSGGTAPYGYSRAAYNTKIGQVRVLQDGEWCIAGQEKVFWIPGDEKEIEVVKFIFEQRAKRISYSLIVEMLNNRGISCPKRGRWKNKDQKWSTITIKTIIENPAYYGARPYNRNSMSKIRADREGWDSKAGVQYPHWKLDKSQWIIFENAHDAIVDKELWVTANAVAKRSKNGNAKFYTPYMLSSLIICGRCGFHFQGQTTGVKGKYYYRYICGGYNSKRVCEYSTLKRDPLEQFVLQCVKETLLTEVIQEKIEARLTRLLELKPNADKAEIARLNKIEGEVEQKLVRIRTAIEEGGSIQLFKDRILQLEQEKKQIQEEIAGRRVAEEEGIKVSKASKLIAEFADNFEEVFASAQLPEQKDLLRRCVSKIVVNHEEKKVHCYIRKVPLVIRDMCGLLEGPHKTNGDNNLSPSVIRLVAGAETSDTESFYVELKMQY